MHSLHEAREFLAEGDAVQVEIWFAATTAAVLTHGADPTWRCVMYATSSS